MLRSIFAAICVSVVLAGPAYRKLGTVSASNAAFLVPTKGAKAGEKDFWISQFTGNPFGHGRISVVRGVSSLGDDVASAKVEQLDASFAWPNMLSRAPDSVFGGYTMIVPDGFLVPGKSNGNVYAVSVNDDGTYGDPVALAAVKKGYFYHMAAWRDMDGDGKLDLLTARATKPIVGQAKGELVWFKQPESDPLSTSPWEETVVTAGPDVIFAVREGANGACDIFAAQFFTNALSVYSLAANGSVTAATAIDAEVGPAYSVQLVDLDADGRQELLVTTHVGGSGGAVLAYEIPDDVHSQNFTKHTLATGFKVTEGGFNQAAPGFPYPVHTAGDTSAPPSILVAGDGSQSAYLLSRTGGFEYSVDVVEDVKGTVGSLGVGSFLGHGDSLDFAVPNYDKGYVDFYTFAPAPKASVLRGAAATVAVA